ncbi:hypothetical protein CONCODRAFT_9312 [Conidiobolus coronatus NRRL 28638]|uniref:Uncharacterized protein n=1 Tax=Conidiobolus coronatus (strain ATCC 28846 / CBS 209.66 / NRRL 28638) TaxID=796925 RepID=A0A137P0M8_CONC2|nr:hypothetical protein CONCODRAFT_9312 [Conidiobolus coronatus NRRL 28638]|eukprot:KXN68424.1 hypothetical protein CONCODRAFT_9312 [Conidiobolus coronatus NRRL 28638]
MYLNQELLNDKQFKIVLGLLISVFVLLILGVVYVLLLRPWLAKRKEEKYERANNSDSFHMPLVNTASLESNNIKKDKVPRISMLKFGDIVARASITPESSLPKHLLMPPKRYTPFTFDVQKASAIEPSTKEPNKI